jgi:arylsulfatase A-like enzyme
MKAVMTQGGIPAGSVAFQPEDRAYVRSLFDGGFREFDVWFADLWDFLERGGLARNTIVVLTADHGEELLERGHVGHASTTGDGHLHEEIVRVPLILWLPERLDPPDLPRTIDRMTSHIDILPTLVAVLGVEPPARGFKGRNVLEPLPERLWMAATSKAGFTEVDPENVELFRFAAARGRWKLHLDLHSGAPVRRRLFDLAADPGERVEVGAAHPDVVEALGVPLLATAQSMRPPHTPKASPSARAAAATPEWIFPTRDGAYGYDDVRDRFRLEWTGSPDGDYLIQYEAGEGDRMLAGELRATGTVKDFGVISRRYWNTWIVPLRTFRLRVGPAGGGAWSVWRVLEAEE